jgi:hypothetical protein
MGLDALSKLASAGEAVYQNLSKKWEHRKRREAEKEWLAQHEEEIRQRNEFLSLVTTKITGDSAPEMAPLICNPYERQRAVFLITTPISFGVVEVSQSSYKLLARHVGMSLNSVSHWAVCVIDRALGECYCYDLMSDRLELTMLGKNYFRVAAITPEFVDTWSSCYYIGETTKTHDEIQEIGRSSTYWTQPSIFTPIKQLSALGRQSRQGTMQWESHQSSETGRGIITGLAKDCTRLACGEDQIKDGCWG